MSEIVSRSSPPGRSIVTRSTFRPVSRWNVTSTSSSPEDSMTGLTSDSASTGRSPPSKKKVGASPLPAVLRSPVLPKYTPRSRASERAALAVGRVPVVARLHPARQARFVPPVVRTDPETPAGAERLLLGSELVANPESRHVDEHEVPGRVTYVLDDPLDLGVELHEVAEFSGNPHVRELPPARQPRRRSHPRARRSSARRSPAP